MATVKKPYKKAGEKVIVHCDVASGNADNCLDCTHCMVKEPFCDPKCYFPNHVINKFMPGFVCKDFSKKVKK